MELEWFTLSSFDTAKEAWGYYKDSDAESCYQKMMFCKVYRLWVSNAKRWYYKRSHSNNPGYETPIHLPDAQSLEDAMAVAQVFFSLDGHRVSSRERRDEWVTR
jgi:hypothetical protein